MKAAGLMRPPLCHAGNQQHDAEMVVSKAAMLCDAFAQDIHQWREAQVDQVRGESKKIVAASRRTALPAPLSNPTRT